MAATADQPVLTALDILRSALERGVTGRLSRVGSRGPGREIYVMQGQILAAHGPDDGPWIVRRLVNSGALTERQGKAFIRRLTRGIPFEELILGHVPDSLLETLLAGRFRQNLLDFLSSPPPIDFQPMDTLFVPNLQAGHDTRDILSAVVELRERIGPLMRHRGALTLRLGPSMPASREEARVVDLCEPPISLRDLLTYSPFETGETLDKVMRMLESGALVSDEGIRLKSTRGRGPTSDYAVEELFTIEGPPEPEVHGSPAGPIVPDHLALLREESDAPVLGDFGRIPAAFRGDEDVDLSADLPRLNTSHLVLVPDAPSASEAAGPAAHDSVVPVLVESAPSLVGSSADLTTPSTGLFDSDHSALQDEGGGLGTDPYSEGGLFDPAAPGLRPTTTPPPSTALPNASEPEPEPEPAVGPPVDDSMPASWRDLSALGFGSPQSPPVAKALVREEPDTQPVALPEVARQAPPPTPEAESALPEGPLFDPDAFSAVLSEDDLTPDVFQSHDEDPTAESRPEPDNSAVRAGIDLRQRAVELEPEDASDATEVFEAPSARLSPVSVRTAASSPIPAEQTDQNDLYDGASMQALFGIEAEDDDAREAEEDGFAFEAEDDDAREADDDAFAMDAQDDDFEAEEDGFAFEAEDDDAREAEDGFEAVDDSMGAGDDDEAQDDGFEDDRAESTPVPDAEEGTGNALVDAARRYLEEASERRQKTKRKPPTPEPELVADSSAERKFTGFDFDVDASELAMFDDHDRYRGGGQGQFTLKKDLLDKVELLPAPKPKRTGVRLPPVAEDLPEEESLIEMGEASAEEIAEAGVVSLAFSAPTLEADQVQYKIGVAGEVSEAVVRQLDLAAGAGIGQTTIQLIVDAAAGPFARLFHGVRVGPDGALDEERIFANLQQRPEGERRSLLDRGLIDFIERTLSTGAEELPDDAIDALLSEIAGYQQRLRM